MYMCMYHVHAVPKATLDPLGMELHTVVVSRVVAGMKPRFSERAVN